MSLPLSPPTAQAASIGDVAGRSVVLHYGDPVREYEALRSGAMLVNRGERLRLYADGVAAAETIAGLVTNDITGLAVGEGCYACALTPKGRMIADVRVFALGETRLLLDTSPRAAEGFAAMLRKYVNPRLATLTDVSEELRDLGLFGVQSRRIVAELTGVPAPTLQLLALYGHVAVEIDGRALLVARVPDLGLEGYDLFGDAELLHELAVRATALGATPTGLDAWTVARIEAGRPDGARRATAVFPRRDARE
jgi:glycine cleavage system aminomethyltransferase T